MTDVGCRMTDVGVSGKTEDGRREKGAGCPVSVLPIPEKQETKIKKLDSHVINNPERVKL